MPYDAITITNVRDALITIPPIQEQKKSQTFLTINAMKSANLQPKRRLIKELEAYKNL